MAALGLTYLPGATPLDASEAEGLIPGHISTQGELDWWEKENVSKGLAWARRSRGDLFTEDFCRELHRRMFGETWDWAGEFRRSDKNIGSAWGRIGVDLREALDTARYWCENKVFSPRETAARFHHRLVLVHPFPNGNGRHSRAMADALCARMGGDPIDWGPVGKAGNVRDDYIRAMRAADTGDFGPLLAFVRA